MNSLKNKFEDFPLLGEMLSCLQNSQQSSLCSPLQPQLSLPLTHNLPGVPPRPGRVLGSLSPLGLAPPVLCPWLFPLCHSGLQWVFMASRKLPLPPGLVSLAPSIHCILKVPKWLGSLVVIDFFSCIELEMAGGQGWPCVSSSKRLYLIFDR